MPATTDGTDAALLAAFAYDRDDAAFAELVRRHGPLALGVCRRVLRGSADADDAYQAALVVLARRAGGLRDPGRVGPWLHGVAFRCARRARRAAARRHSREQPLDDSPAPQACDDWHDVRPELDAEIARLPDKLRAALVLCELQGLDRAAAAASLGVPPGTVSSRLARAKDALRAGLVRRGVTLTAAGLTTVLTEANAGAAGPPAAATVPSAATLALAHMETAVFVSSGLLKLLLALLTAAGLTAAGVALLPADPPPKPAPADAVAEERAKLIGEWRVESVTVAGRAVRAEGPDKIVGDKAVITADEIRLRDVSKYTLLPGTTPTGIDLVEQVGPAADRKSMPGVYKLDGDTLTIHTPIPHKTAPPARPSDFESKADGGTMLLVLKRAPADPVKAEKAKLVGEWRVESVMIGDQPADRRTVAVMYKPWTFTADKIDRGLGDTPYRLDPTADPKRLDVDTETGEVETTQAGIYKLDGDTLTVHSRTVVRGRPADRPAGFDPVPGRDTRLIVLNRVDPAAAAAEKAKLLGGWEVLNAKFNGRDMGREERDRTFGNAIVFTPDEMRAKSSARYALSLGTSPRRIDLAVRYKPGDAETTRPGIYRIEGDTLTLHLATQLLDAPPTRPEDFESKPGANTVLVVLKRTKLDAAKAEQTKLAGTWRLTKCVRDGAEDKVALNAPAADKFRTAVFDGRTVGLPGHRTGPYTVRAGAGGVNQIDVVEQTANGLTVDLVGVYRLDVSPMGDATLTIHSRSGARPFAGQLRPADLECKPGGGSELLVFTRVSVDPQAPVGARLVGAWTVQSATAGGDAEKGAEMFRTGARVGFGADVLSVGPVAAFDFSLDPTNSPATIDLALRTPLAARMTLKGICKLAGDTLTLSLSPGERPTDYTPGKTRLVVVLRRDVPGAADPAPGGGPPAAFGTLSGRVRVGGTLASAGRVTVYFGPGNTKFVGAVLVGGAFAVERMPAGAYEVHVEAEADGVRRAHAETVTPPTGGPLREVRDFDLK